MKERSLKGFSLAFLSFQIRFPLWLQTIYVTKKTKPFWKETVEYSHRKVQQPEFCAKLHRLYSTYQAIRGLCFDAVRAYEAADSTCHLSLQNGVMKLQYGNSSLALWKDEINFSTLSAYWPLIQCTRKVLYNIWILQTVLNSFDSMQWWELTKILTEIRILYFGHISRRDFDNIESWAV